MPNYFVNLKNANAEVARLAGEIATLSAERDALKASIAERDTAAESVRAKFDATVVDLTQKLTEANAQVASLTAAAKTAGQQAAEVIAAQGVDPSKLPKVIAAPQAATMKRADFNALTPFDRMQFAKSGGRLTE